MDMQNGHAENEILSAAIPICRLKMYFNVFITQNTDMFNQKNLSETARNIFFKH